MDGELAYLASKLDHICDSAFSRRKSGAIDYFVIGYAVSLGVFDLLGKLGTWQPQKIDLFHDLPIFGLVGRTFYPRIKSIEAGNADFFRGKRIVA